MDMTLNLLVLFGVFSLLLILESPVAVALGIAAIASFFVNNIPFDAFTQRMFAPLDSFTLLAVPMFILAGNLATQGGVAKWIIDLAECFFGSLKGGLAVAVVVSCAFFGALSGSGTATVVAIGSFTFPLLVKRGYPGYFSSGLVSAAGCLGPVIPPSIIMVVIGSITGISVGDMFLAGFPVGLLMAGLMAAAAVFISMRRGYGTTTPFPPIKEIAVRAWKALPALGMPVIILGGIYGGIFTPTEAAAVAVLYTLVVGMFIYRSVGIKDLKPIFVESALMTGIIFFVVAASGAFSWIVSRLGVSEMIKGWFLNLTDSSLVFLFLMTVVLLIFGTFMEGIAFTILLTPIFFPIAKEFGIDPIHFGLVTNLSVVVGMITPPVAVCLYAASSISKQPLNDVIRGMLPFFACTILALVLVILFPGISTGIVRLIGH